MVLVKAEKEKELDKIFNKKSDEAIDCKSSQTEIEISMKSYYKYTHGYIEVDAGGSVQGFGWYY